MEKEFTEVCGEDYPDYPFETYNEAVLYASDPEMYEGCTDPTAFNPNEEAILDDGCANLWLKVVKSLEQKIMTKTPRKTTIYASFPRRFWMHK